MPDYPYPYRSDDAEGSHAGGEKPAEDASDIPASVAFMEMMRQAAARTQRENAPAETEQPQSAPAVSRQMRRAGASTGDIPTAAPPAGLHGDGIPVTPREPEVRRVRRRRAARRGGSSLLGGVLRSIIIVTVAAGLTTTILTWFTPQQLLREEVRDELSAAIATESFATFMPTAQPTPNWEKNIGIVSGHRGPGGDPGAVCTDASGTVIPPTENDINFSVATRIVDALRGLGYSVDLLDEFDPRLDNYQAAALVSIHANTCREWPGGEIVSGFLIAGPAARTTMRGNDELLVGCIADHYGAMTGLLRRSGVTRDMTHYHNFREIHPLTPAAILELGFMLADSQLLTTQPDLMAQAITNGILCFVDPALAPARPAPAPGI